MKRLFEGIPGEETRLIITILASQDIEARTERQGPDRFTLWVAPQDAERATHHLNRYALENPPKDPVPGKPVQDRALFFNPAALAAAGFLVLIHMVLVRTGLQKEAIFSFGASPYTIGQGHVFRAVTALFLHADGRHLLGNVAGLVILAGPLIRVTGYGTGLLFLLAAAVSGNLIANSLSQSLGLSIGASTAVMAAAGLLAARQSLGAHLRKTPAIPFWQPVTAAVILMVMFSHGPNTDLSAHLFGMAGGMGTGWLMFPLYPYWHRPWMEPLALILIMVILAGAFFQGLV